MIAKGLWINRRHRLPPPHEGDHAKRGDLKVFSGHVPGFFEGVVHIAAFEIAEKLTLPQFCMLSKAIKRG